MIKPQVRDKQAINGFYIKFVAYITLPAIKALSALKTLPALKALSALKPLSAFLMLITLLGCDGVTKNSVETEVANNIPIEATTSAPELAEQTVLQEVTTPTERVVEGDVLPFSKLETHMILGTGSVQGAYFPIGGVICRLLNRHKSVNNVRCSIESTAGSIYNLRELREGNFDIVAAQSDWQYHAYNGSSTFEKDGANTSLRAVFSLEADPVTLIVQAGSDIASFEDLENRTVSFGYARSLQHRIINDLLDVMGWTDDNFKEVVRMSDANQIEGLCAGDVEATLFVMSSLNDYLKGVDDACELKIIPIEGEYVKKIIADKPYYRVGRVPAGKYLDTTEDVPSFGLGAVFVASETTSVKAIYSVVKEVVENFKDFKSLHPSLDTLELKEMPYAGIAIPMHPGAIRYYKEARLLR